MVIADVLHHLIVHSEVVVNEQITDARNFGSGNFRLDFSKIVGKLLDGLAKNL